MKARTQRDNYELRVEYSGERITSINIQFYDFTESEIRTICDDLRSGRFTVTRKYNQTEVLDLTTPKETK